MWQNSFSVQVRARETVTHVEGQVCHSPLQVFLEVQMFFYFFLQVVGNADFGDMACPKTDFCIGEILQIPQ